MTVRWFADRMALYQLLHAHPDWSYRQFAAATRRSKAWVKKWVWRFGTPPHPDPRVALQSQPRARKTPPSAWSDEVIQRILALRETLSVQYNRIVGAKTILAYLHRDPDLATERLPTSPVTVWSILRQHHCMYHRQCAPRKGRLCPAPMREIEIDFMDVVTIPPDRTGKQAHAAEAFTWIDAGTAIPLVVQVDADFHMASVIRSTASILQSHGVPPLIRMDRDPRFVGSTAKADHALSSDRRIEQALAFVLTHATHKRMWLSVMKKEWVNPLLYQEVPDLDLRWLPSGWWRLVTDLSTRAFTPHEVHRQHFEVCVMMQVLSALTTGDLCIRDANRYGNPLARLYSWDDYHTRIAAYGADLAMPTDAAAFVTSQRQWLSDLCATVDAGFPTNDQVVVKKERMSLRRRRRRPPPAGLAPIERAIGEMMPPRSILHALLTTDHWINWTRFFGPISGLEAKIDEPAAKYIAATFCYGCQIGPSAMARALGTRDRRQLALLDQVHITESALDLASQAMIQAYERCSLPQLWGSQDHAAVDGTKWELYQHSLLSEQHIRYGGIALYLVSSTYIALMTNVVACSMWEGHYLLDLLEQNTSVLQPTTIYSDTQGQNEVIFGLAWLRGVELLPRIRHWQHLTMYRPDPAARYTHIDRLFGTQAINWALIQTHLPDLLRIALSIHDGRIRPSMILRLLSSGKSQLAQACRELGRVRRTGMLLRCLHDGDLRGLIHQETNKCEQFNNFVKWVGFGSAGVIRKHDRREQQKTMKYTMLVANALILYTTVKLSDGFRRLIAQGHTIDKSIVTAFNPYGIEHLMRLGAYQLALEEPVQPVDYDSPMMSPIPDE